MWVPWVLKLLVADLVEPICGHLPLGHPHGMEDFRDHQGILFKQLKRFVLQQAGRLRYTRERVATSPRERQTRDAEPEIGRFLVAAGKTCEQDAAPLKICSAGARISNAWLSICRPCRHIPMLGLPRSNACWLSLRRRSSAIEVVTCGSTRRSVLSRDTAFRPRS